jgi:RHS repeat-associated protein
MTEPNGLYYMKARYYDSEIGRFISEDPLGFEGGGLNLYVYAANNPIMFMDPTGLCDTTGLNIAEIYAKVESALKPYLVGGGLIVTGSVTTAAGIITTGAGYGSMPATGPAGFVVGTTGLVVTGVGAAGITVGLDVYSDEFRHRLGLPEWFDVLPGFELLPQH